MPTVNQPFGLSPVMMGDGSPWNGQVRRYYIPAADGSAYYIGDAVISLANSDANGVPGVIKATSAQTLRGVVVGVEVAPVDGVSLAGLDLGLSVINIPAVKARDYYVYVCDDPTVIFEIQGDLTATNQVAANANKNFSLTVAAPNPATLPYSGTVINSGSINVTQALNMKLMGLSQRRPAGGFGAFALWYCRINQHELMGNTAGI